MLLEFFLSFFNNNNNNNNRRQRDNNTVLRMFSEGAKNWEPSAENRKNHPLVQKGDKNTPTTKEMFASSSWLAAS